MKKIRNARDKIIDSEVKKAYDKFKMYLAELDVYEQYLQENDPDKISKFKLLILYIDKGIELKSKKNIEERFKKFKDTIMAIKQKNPDIDLRDISTQKNRKIISDIIYETQKDENFKTADLDAVSVIENFVLYTAVGQVNDNTMDSKTALSTYELSEEQFKRAETSYKKYEQSGIIDIYNNMCKRQNGKLPNKIIHYAAGTLELTPSEARNDLTIMQVLDGNRTTNNSEEKTYTVYNVSKLVIDNIMRDPKLTPEEKNKKICELELAEYERVSKNVEEANRKQHIDKYRIAKEDDSREIS